MTAAGAGRDGRPHAYRRHRLPRWPIRTRRPNAVARPPQGQQHPGRQLAVLGLIFVVLYLFAFFGNGASGSVTERLHPKLGLDLIGGTQVTYQASLLANGQVPSQTSMEEARKII